MKLIEYIIEQMNLDPGIVQGHINDYNEKEDAVIRLKRKKADESRDYIPSTDEIDLYIAGKLTPVEEIGK